MNYEKSALRVSQVMRQSPMSCAGTDLGLLLRENQKKILYFM